MPDAVVKRNGETEPLNVEKLHKVVGFACEGLSGVSESQVELKAQLSFHDGIRTRDIQESLIRAAVDLIDEKNSNYQYVAGRLVNYHIRKDAFGSYTPPTLKKHVGRVVETGLYEPMLLEWYDDDEWETMDSALDHRLDETMTYASAGIFRSKYLVRDRASDNEKMLESPQMAMMLISAAMHHAEKEKRMAKVLGFYRSLSRYDISLPTPIMAGMRTSTRQFSSCTLIECGDSIDSISRTTSSIMKYISKRAGIGLCVSGIRALNSRIGSGLTTHTGLIPFLKVFQAAVRSCNQGGVRVGAATVYYPIWHADVENLIPLKDNRGTEDSRVRHVDYGVLFSKIFYQRLIDGGDISLFNPQDVPELQDAFYRDGDHFAGVYEEYEKSGLATGSIPAMDLFGAFVQQRKMTGRVYLMNIDHANTHGSFIEERAPIKMSNLCTEICLITKPLEGDDGIDHDVGIELVEFEKGAYGKWRAANRSDQPLPLIWELYP